MKETEESQSKVEEIALTEEDEAALERAWEKLDKVWAEEDQNSG